MSVWQFSAIIPLRPKSNGLFLSGLHSQTSVGSSLGHLNVDARWLKDVVLIAGVHYTELENATMEKRFWFFLNNKPCWLLVGLWVAASKARLEFDILPVHPTVGPWGNKKGQAFPACRCACWTTWSSKTTCAHCPCRHLATSNQQSWPKVGQLRPATSSL